jgi:hypothetical protein
MAAIGVQSASPSAQGPFRHFPSVSDPSPADIPTELPGPGKNGGWNDDCQDPSGLSPSRFTDVRHNNASKPPSEESSVWAFHQNDFANHSSTSSSAIIGEGGSEEVKDNESLPPFGELIQPSCPMTFSRSIGSLDWGQNRGIRAFVSLSGARG